MKALKRPYGNVQVGGHRLPAISKTRLPVAPYFCGLLITLPSFFARVSLPPTTWIGLELPHDALLALPIAHLGISRLQVRDRLGAIYLGRSL